MRIWDFTKRGEYFALYVDALDLKHEPVYEAILEGMAKSLQQGHTRLACAKLALFELSVRLTSKRDISNAQSQDLLARTNRLEDEMGCR